MKITNSSVASMLTKLRDDMKAVPTDVNEIPTIMIVPLKDLSIGEIDSIKHASHYSVPNDPTIIDPNNLYNYELVVDRTDMPPGYIRNGKNLGGLFIHYANDKFYLYTKNQQHVTTKNVKFEDMYGICGGYAYFSSATGKVLGYDILHKYTDKLIGDDLKFDFPFENNVPYILSIKSE